MLTSAPTKHGAGVTFYGDFYDLSAVHETIHKIAGQSFVREDVGEYMLGLGYDFRKAFEGQREKRTFGSDPLEKVTYRGFSVLWPFALTQAAMIRHFAGYHTTDHKDQSCLYLLEDCIITSLLASDAKIGKECAEWFLKFRIFPSDYLFSFVTECSRRYLFDAPEKNRFSELPDILRMLDWCSSEYKAFAKEVQKAAKKLGSTPQQITTGDNWPEFRW
jgi:hypothetical protein